MFLMEGPIGLFFVLMMGHALADFGLQHHQFAMGKNRFNDPPGYDPELHGPKEVVWPYYLTAHAGIHGLMVYLITGWLAAGLFEWVAHWLIDFAKTSKWTSVHEDQAFHVLTKCLILIAMILTYKFPT